MTRVLAQYISNGYMTDGKSPNKAFEAAGSLTLDPIEAVILGSSPGPVVKENAPGTFEKFMGVLGHSGGMKPGQ